MTRASPPLVRRASAPAGEARQAGPPDGSLAVEVSWTPPLGLFFSSLFSYVSEIPGSLMFLIRIVWVDHVEKACSTLRQPGQEQEQDQGSQRGSHGEQDSAGGVGRTRPWGRARGQGPETWSSAHGRGARR